MLDLSHLSRYEDRWEKRFSVLPKKDERRILLAHDTRVSLLNDAGIDLWFMRGDELNALHLRVKQGSSLDVSYLHVRVVNLPHIFQRAFHLKK